jgi:hypothetical protein
MSLIFGQYFYNIKFITLKNKKQKMTQSTNIQIMTTQEVASRFNELAKQEKWFEIQDELFSDVVKSIDPPNSRYFGCAEGKTLVRKKGEEFVKRIEAAHRRYTTEPIVAGNHFAVGSEVMLYEVKDGQIVLEQFFY